MFYDKSIISEISLIPIVDYLASIDIEPVSKSGSSFVYNLRNEKTASCFVCPAKNVFNDFGNDKGSIIRLVQNLHQCNFTQAMEILISFKGENHTAKSFSFNP